MKSTQTLINENKLIIDIIEKLNEIAKTNQAEIRRNLEFFGNINNSLQKETKAKKRKSNGRT